MKDSEFINFWKKLSTMIGNGVPLVMSLETIREEYAPGDFAKVLKGIIEDLKGGERFSECLGKHPSYFGKAILQLIASGESAGELDRVSQVVSERLAEGVLSTPSDNGDEALRESDALGEGESQTRLESKGPSTKELLDSILQRAIKEGATDIHFDCFFEKEKGSFGTLRFRVNGVLEEREELPMESYNRILSRLKVMSCLDVGERRLPQDGRIKLKIEEETVDFHVSTGPAIFGEGACIRVMKELSAQFLLSRQEDIFPEKELRDRLYKASESSHGLFIATGPTGSGKTTTIYSLLVRHDGEKKKIMTIEDPVELVIPKAHQSQIDTRRAYDYVGALRHFMRMDPDLIFCSEVRDPETAILLTQIALTGHLVLTQLHAEDSIACLLRLIDIGVEPYLLADTIRGIVSQRLLRKLCPKCKQASEEDLHHLREIQAKEGLEEQDSAGVFRPGACPNCAHTGYKGRMAVYEFLEPNEQLLRLLHGKSEEIDRKSIQREAGMSSLFENALNLVAQGETSLREVSRIITWPLNVNKGLVI